MWHGSIATIPTNYALCDGNNGTPDLRNRFVVCADADVGGIAKTNVDGWGPVQTGGDANLSQYFLVTSGVPSNTGGTATVIGPSYAKGDHTHSVEGYTNPDWDASTPPYYALAFIMKVT